MRLLVVCIALANASSEAYVTLKNLVNTDPDYKDLMIGLVDEMPRIRATILEAPTGTIDLAPKDAKDEIWRLLLEGKTMEGMIESFKERNIAVDGQMIKIMRQLDAFKQIDADFLDSVISEIPKRVPNYATSQLGETLRAVLRHPLPWWPPYGHGHLRLFFSYCVDRVTLANNCPQTREVPMDFYAPVRVYFMTNTASTSFLQNLHKEIMESHIHTYPMY